MTKIKWQKRYKTLMGGLQTVLGIRKVGFFAPYRFAASVPRTPPHYVAFEELFRRHEAGFESFLNRIAENADALREAIAGSLASVWSRGAFESVDGAAAFTVIQDARPKRIIEVGSGASTHIMAAAIRSANLDCAIRCIDPVPRKDISELGVNWSAEVLSTEHVPLFAELEAGDIAFFDSSHLLMQGTDVDIITNRLLPVLKPGVMAHFHDVFLPAPYPDAWRLRQYNEQLGLSGWLLGGVFRPVFVSGYVGAQMAARLRTALEHVPGRHGLGGSLWMRR